MTQPLRITTQRISKSVENTLSECGIIFRIFSRQKSEESIKAKIEKNPEKYGDTKKIQDIIGIRIALYFPDDIEIAKSILCKKFNYLPNDSTIDTPTDDTFSATRYNLILSLPPELSIKNSIESKYTSMVDETFEVQIRTILSEGWHEVEHDLRYKRLEDWRNLKKESRALNGVYATIETCDWTLLKIFEDVAYKHYKQSSWAAMIQNKFRLRFCSSDVSSEISSVLESDPDLAKSIYRTDRKKILESIISKDSIPINADNVIFIANRLEQNSESLKKLEPTFFTIWWSGNQAIE